LLDCSRLTHRIVNSNDPTAYRYFTPYGIHKVWNTARGCICNRYIQQIKVGNIRGFSKSLCKNGIVSRKLGD
jgi:hypothetical protein